MKALASTRVTFDFKAPQYDAVISERIARLQTIRQWHLEDLEAKLSFTRLDELRAYYRENPAQFIDDWGWTFDPRNADIDLPTYMPFRLFPKQYEFVDYIVGCWKGRRPGLVEKSRDVGASWLAMSLACTLCLFTRGIAIGFGSRKAEYVDQIGTLKPLLPKGRIFMEKLPPEFRGNWLKWRDAPYMRISFPDTGSIISGEAGDDIGRGDRTTIHFVDEAAHLERPELVDASLSATTNCRIDMSSVKGMNNPFAAKRHGGKIEPFIFDWRDDPRKDDAWYQKQCDVLDPIVVAQEIDRDYLASVTGVVIPPAWVRAAINARDKLGLPASGQMGMGLDIADEGRDKNAAVGGQGIQIDFAEEWSGKGSDIFFTVQEAFRLADEHGIEQWYYDADGVGASARGDARIINQERQKAGLHRHHVLAYRGSREVYNPDAFVEGTMGANGKGRTNKDYYANRKAQAWFKVRRMFQLTYRWVVEGKPCDPDEIISLNPNMPNLWKLVNELSQAVYKQNPAGKMVIDKTPDGVKSPNLADGLVIRFAPMEGKPLQITNNVMQTIAVMGKVRNMRPRARMVRGRRPR